MKIYLVPLTAVLLFFVLIGCLLPDVAPWLAIGAILGLLGACLKARLKKQPIHLIWDLGKRKGGTRGR